MTEGPRITSNEINSTSKLTPEGRVAAGFLWLMIVMCFGIVILGGYVRLTDSGLAIPEWPRFTLSIQHDEAGNVIGRTKSLFPPGTEEGWATLQQTFVEEVPGFESGIALSAFKRMFWIEWTHRAVAKSFGVVYLAFMIYVLAKPSLRRKYGWWVVGGFLLLASQAVLGAVVVFTHLKPMKVALHLVVAFLFTSLIVWFLLQLLRPGQPKAERRQGPNPILPIAIFVYCIVLFQVFSGGLVAGAKAGFMLNTWPSMGDRLIPPGLSSDMGFFRNFMENPIMIQFFHRWFAMAAALAVLFLVFRSFTVEVSRPGRFWLRALMLVVVLQVILGIYTLLLGVQTHLALTHQLMGLVLLLNVLLVVYETKNYRVRAEEELAIAEEKAAMQPAEEAAHA